MAMIYVSRYRIHRNYFSAVLPVAYPMFVGRFLSIELSVALQNAIPITAKFTEDSLLRDSANLSVSSKNRINP